jgi:4-diphosphocytidyl-2-C-methyl-D-erythritol kinase
MQLTGNSYTRVTLALDVVRMVADGLYKGYHELGTVKHQIDLCDTISVEDARADAVGCDDPAVPCDGRNICLRVAHLMRVKYGFDRHVRITIKKRIPVMGGLAGGSANAATTLALLNKLWDMGLTVSELTALGRDAGMDVPYYFIGGTAFDSEAGLRLEPVVTRCTFVFVLACPDFGVPTKEAYAEIDYAAAGKCAERTGQLLNALLTGNRERAVSFMHNDFELSVFKKFSRLPAIKNELLDAGCTAAFLTGSGSTIVGVAHDLAQTEKIRKKVSCKTIISSTLHRQAD